MSITLPKKLIGYYKDCFISDNRNLVIRNIYANKIESLLFIEEEELINGSVPYYPIDKDYAMALQSTLEIYKREKGLYYGSLFLVSSIASFGKVCAPLLLFKANVIEKGEFFYVSFEGQKPSFQYDLLKDFLLEEDLEKLRREIEPILEEGYFTEDSVWYLENSLKKYINDLASDLIAFPSLYSNQKLKALFENDSNKKPLLLPVSTVFISKKSTSTAGVINELNLLQHANKELSISLKEVLTAQKVSEQKIYSSGDSFVGYLNDAQHEVVKQLSTNNMVKISGPPGTGKSHTIVNVATSYLHQGKSVLITSNNDEALDVVYDKIVEQLGLDDVVVRAGKKELLKRLKVKLSSLLAGRGTNKHKETFEKLIVEIGEIEALYRRHKTLLERKEKYFTHLCEIEKEWGEIATNKTLRNTTNNLLEKKFKNHEDKNLFLIWETIEELDNYNNKCFDSVIELLKKKVEANLSKELAFNRKNLRTFYNVLKARTSQRQQRLFNELDFSTLLSYFPIWIIKLSDLYKILPLHKELFDLVILDEATQCNITSALPAIQRGQQILLAGDGQQLRHFSFLSQSRQQELKKRYKIEDESCVLNYRTESILDLCDNSITRQEQNVFLNYHYRSHPSIIDYSNRNFYNNSLKIMTKSPIEKVHQKVTIKKTKGKQSKTGYNKVEADYILSRIATLISKQKEMPLQLVNSIGVISPFRKQVDYIAKRVTKELTLEEIKRHEIMVGTPFSFQGSEKDIVYLSIACDNDSLKKVKGYLNKSNEFNVAITRARNHQYIYKSFDSYRLEVNHILRGYLEAPYLENFRENENIKNKDLFAEEVGKVFFEKGYSFAINFEVGGLDIDIILWKRNRYIAVDLIGFPGMFQEAFDLDKYHHYKKVGIPIYPLSYTGWKYSKDKCIEQLEKIFNR